MKHFTKIIGNYRSTVPFAVGLLLSFMGMPPSTLYSQVGVNLGPDTSICGSIILNSNLTGDHYLWSTGDTTDNLTIDSTGLYWLEVTQASQVGRDSIFVNVSNPRLMSTPSDTSICGAQKISFQAQANSDLILWYDNLAPINVINSGAKVDLDIADTSTIYLQALDLEPSQVGETDNITGALFRNSLNRGLSFDVFTSFLLDSVVVYPDQPMTIQVSLSDNQGTALNSKTFTLNTTDSSATTLPLGFFVGIGSGYTLTISSISSGSLLRIFPYSSFPHVVPGVLSINSSLGNTGVYWYFFDWSISIPSCGSAIDSFAINVAPTPNLVLTEDTALCNGPYTLDVTQPLLASYSWNTGDSTSSISITQSQTLIPTITIGDCSISDTQSVTIITVPQVVPMTDTTICGPGEVALTATSAADLLLWYQDTTTAEVIGAGPSFLVNIIDTSTYYVRGSETVPSTTGETDIITNTAFRNSTARGLTFDVFTSCNLDTVTVYPDRPMTVGVELRDQAGQILQSKSFTLTTTDSSATPLDLGFPLQPGNGYTLTLNSISAGANLLRVFPYANFPHVAPGVVSINSSLGNIGVYWYFFDWKLSVPLCFSSFKAINVLVAPVPQINLGNDSIFCGGAYTLNLPFDTLPGISYLWNTQDTIASITVSQTGTYTLDAQLGICSQTDSVSLQFLPIPPDPILVDTTICSSDTVLLKPSITGDLLAWYSDSTGEQIFAISDTIFFYAQDSSTAYFQAINTSQISLESKAIDSSTFAYRNNVDRGQSFDVLTNIRLNSVLVYPESPQNITISLLDSTGRLVQKKPFSITQVDSSGNRLTLDFDIPRGNRYELLATFIDGNGFGREFPFSGYPIEQKDIIRLNPFRGNANVYWYFYDWILEASSCGSNIQPVDVNVRFSLQFPDSIYNCSDTLLDADDPAPSYIWNTGENTRTIIADTTSIYWVELSDQAGCLYRDSVFVEIPTTAGLAEDGILCGEVLETNYGNDAIFRWSTGDSSTTLMLTDTGTYSVIVLEPRGCLLTDTITVTGFSEFPALSLGQDLIVCDSVTLDAGVPGNRFRWSTGDTTQMITASSTGIYICEAINENNCSTLDTIAVLVNLSPLADFTASPQGLSVFFVSNPNTFSQHFWDFGDGITSNTINPFHIYQSGGTYTVTLILSNDCGRDTITQEISVVPESIEAPTEVLPVVLYPNPVQQMLNVTLLPSFAGSGDISYRIIDSKGNWVKKVNPVVKTPSFQIDVRGFSPGLYVLFIQSPTGTISVKFIKQ